MTWFDLPRHHVAVVALPAGQEETWLGVFGERWFHTVCTAAGCVAAKLDPDVVGSDFFVHDQTHEVIRVQVKTTAHPQLAGVGFSYQLDVRVYDRLREGGTFGYLALVVMHAPHPRWTGHCERGSIVRASMYWSRLTGAPPVNNQATINVPVPIQNPLTPQTVGELF